MTQPKYETPKLPLTLTNSLHFLSLSPHKHPIKPKVKSVISSQNPTFFPIRPFSQLLPIFHKFNGLCSCSPKQSSPKFMKREREGEFEVLDMVDCLMLLSKVEEPWRKNTAPAPDSGKVFVCKTCNREFSSFQALGGHRASHKKPNSKDADGPPTKPKAHECNICGLHFPIGQALGGHMRRHRTSTTAAAVVEKSDGGGRRGFVLDLNLTPIENNLKLQLTTPFVDCFY